MAGIMGEGEGAPQQANVPAIELPPDPMPGYIRRIIAALGGLEMRIEGAVCNEQELIKKT